MKTTLELPDDLMHQIKLRAARENRKLKDLVAELLRRGLAAEQSEAAPRGTQVKLPLIRCAHPALPDEEMTPDRVAQILADEEAGEALRR